MSLSDEHVRTLLEARCTDPFAMLGLHREADGLWMRAWVIGASAITLIARDGSLTLPLVQRAEGLFEARVPGHDRAFPYELEVTDAHGLRRIRDIYSFWWQLSEWDLDRFREGTHHHLERVLGAVPCSVDGCKGVRFAVWAPAAERVSVIGNWNGFDGRWHPMRLRHPYGVWELFIPGLAVGAVYKYEIRGRDGRVLAKADPMARACEVPPATASIVSAPSRFTWTDQDWMTARNADPQAWRRKPMAIYEVHAGSWMRGDDDRRLGWVELGERLADHCTRLGFTHVEFLPVAAHPFEGSWGYQVSGWWAPNSRHGSADDLRAMIDLLHARGLGVIVDFVPAHFPRDDFCLRHFDGHPCYEYADPREGEHREWGTLVFNWRRPEVRNFLIGSALHWLREYHVDGLRVDAVSAMLYRDYDRKAGEWVANEHGGNENLEAISFLRDCNRLVHELFPGVPMIAEESTGWKGITAPPEFGGLGFDLKWNMGWMHDSLRYLKQDPLMRSGVHDWITFHQWYAYDEAWVLPLSHDEVVHGKGSLLNKAGGDYPARLAQVRQLLGWQIAIPGRPLLFMGAEFAQGSEWAWQRSLDWDEAAQPERQGIARFLAAALTCYRGEAALHAADDDRDGFRWVDCENRNESVIAFLRRAPGARDVLVVVNFTPVPRPVYPLGVPQAGPWTVLLNADVTDFGGSGGGPAIGSTVNTTDESPQHDWAGVLRVDLPAFGFLILAAPR